MADSDSSIWMLALSGYLTKVTGECHLHVQPHPKVNGPPEWTSVGLALSRSHSQPISTGQELDQARKREA